LPASTERSDEQLVCRIDAVNSRVCAAQLEMLRLLAEADRRRVWEGWGARDMAHWVCMRYAISHWKALRWIAAAHALEGLPLVAEALATGELSLDKTVELTRFATQETEARLVVWAQGVSVGCIREKGDLLHRSLEEARDAEQARSLRWWYSKENSRFGLSAELPAADGAVVARALGRLAERVPVMPDEHGEWSVDARRADALVMLCSARIAHDPDPDRATVVIHARVDGAVDASGATKTEPRLHSGQIEGGRPSTLKWPVAWPAPAGSRWWPRTPPASP
jgi:hypothetical protein